MEMIGFIKPVNLIREEDRNCHESHHDQRDRSHREGLAAHFQLHIDLGADDGIQDRRSGNVQQRTPNRTPLCIGLRLGSDILRIPGKKLNQKTPYCPKERASLQLNQLLILE